MTAAPRLLLLLSLALGSPGCLASCNEPGADLPAGMPEAPCKCAPDAGADSSCRIAYRAAQICPDQSPFPFCSRIINTSTDIPLILSNRGLAPLRISSVELLGDDNCAFGTPTLHYGSPEVPMPLGTPIPYNKDAFVRISYRPKKAAADYTILRIKSNAENFPQLDIAVCGQGVTQAGAPDGGACLTCTMMPRSQRPACGNPDGGS